MTVPCYRLMMVTAPDQFDTGRYLAMVRACALSGVTAVQLRAKHLSRGQRILLATHLKAVLDGIGIPLIINDDVDLAMAVDCAGVHLGRSDGCPAKARERLGPDKILGFSVDSLAALAQANTLPLDYIGASAVFATRNKPDVSTLWGLYGLKTLCIKSKHPVVGIGGITARNAGSVIRAGAQGIAVIGALHDIPNPASGSITLRQILDNTETTHA